MNGIYLHIPFCKKRCIYCDFYSTVKGEETITQYVKALCNELSLRKDFLPSLNIDSVYIGGGTPSLLSPKQLETIFKTLTSIYFLNDNAEVTLEANPDDISGDFIRSIASTPVNRVSLGVQSFDDRMLKFLNRRHSSLQAIKAITLLAEKGLENISMDLIYSLPGQTLSQWEQDIDKALLLPIKHLSSYTLTYEEGTPLMRMLRNGNISEADEELSLTMYTLLMDKVANAGWEHYEISNFATPGYRAKHNSGYWKGMFYLGCGPSAHSYDGTSRTWNAKDIDRYITQNGDTRSLQEKEIITQTMRWDETVMVALRTKEGIDLTYFSNLFGNQEKDKLLHYASRDIQDGNLKIEGQRLHLTRKGLFVSDSVIVNLMRE